jgi:uncharacterized protein (TIGR02391 family)
MTSLRNLIDDGQVFLTLEPEALAGFLLQSLKASPTPINYWNYWLGIRQDFRQIPEYQLKMSFSSAWSYLAAEGLIGPNPDSNYGSFIVTKRGHELQSPADIEKLATRSLLRKSFLHPLLQTTVYAQFLSGNYDLAVIQAYKLVEIAVRDKSQLSSLDGMKLMRAAFKPVSKPGDPKKLTPGPLTDTQDEVSEQEGLCNIFAGAMGWCRNPVHH